MDLIEQHKLIEAIMAADIPDSEIEAHNTRIAQLQTIGYIVRWEPLYDERGFSVAKRIGLFATSEGYKPRLVEECFYWRGRVDGTQWTPITKEHALRYTNRDGKIIAGW
jgi:hypothetical protein